MALMRFGNFTSLSYMESSSTDVYSDTATFSFTNSSYSSRFLHFDGFEIFNRDEQNVTVANYTVADQFIAGKYSGGGIPFIDFENLSIQVGAVISPEIIHGQNWNQVLAALQNPSSPAAQGIIGSANIFTAAICAGNATINATAPVCKQSYVKAIIG